MAPWRIRQEGDRITGLRDLTSEVRSTTWLVALGLLIVGAYVRQGYMSDATDERGKGYSAISVALVSQVKYRLDDDDPTKLSDVQFTLRGMAAAPETITIQLAPSLTFPRYRGHLVKPPVHRAAALVAVPQTRLG